MNYKKIVVSNDWHIPYLDKDLFDLHCQFLRDFKPDIYIINGDFLDCSEISKFGRSPFEKTTIVQEILHGRCVLDKLREVLPKNCRILFVEGNHDFRLKSYTYRYAPALAGLDGIGLEEQLHLDDMKIEWYEIRDDSARFMDNYVQQGDLFIGHFDKVNMHSAYTAKALVEQRGVSIIQAHTHRFGVFMKRTIDGRQLVGIENGCMCELTPTYTGNVNWQQGWSVIYQMEGYPSQIFPIHVQNGMFIWDKKVYGVITLPVSIGGVKLE